MTAQTFGRKGQAGDAELARRREAFLAQERARRANAPQADPLEPEPRFSHSAPPGTAAKPAKSIGIAYLCWFLFGAIGAHRHYLGYHTSAIVQVGLWVMGWVMALGGNIFLAVPVLIVFGLWVLADAFIIPSLCREANARTQQQNVQYAFS